MLLTGKMVRLHIVIMNNPKGAESVPDLVAYRIAMNCAQAQNPIANDIRWY